MADTKRIFFPGCSLSAYSPEVVEETLNHLQNKLSGTGAVLKCCGKPTKALGQQEKFKKKFASLQNEINKLGAEEVIVACQSCYLTMSEYCEQKITSLWELFPEIGLPEKTYGEGEDSNLTFAIHDSCSTRDIHPIHDGIRWIINELGYDIEELEHSREDTRCCGYGGMILPVNPELAQKIMRKRASQAESEYMVTYCAACRGSMATGGKTALHILDLVFRGPWTEESDFPEAGANPLKSWAKRYQTKRKIKKLS